MAETFENPADLATKLGEILISGSLYRNFVYEGKNCHVVNTHAVNSPHYGMLPKRLKMSCEDDHCHQETWWETNESEVYFNSGFIKERRYTCRNCGNKSIYYFFIWQDKETASVFVKVGQWPPLSIELPKDLARILDKDDAELYKKALIDANFSHGIGAIAYFRRVLENKINDLIDLIATAARTANFESDQLKNINVIKGSHRVEDKIDFASKILPPHLKPGGHDPLKKLYSAASAGLHGESDEDCLAIFRDARFIFEYLFRNLTVADEEAREYVQRLSLPIGPK